MTKPIATNPEIRSEPRKDHFLSQKNLFKRVSKARCISRSLMILIFVLAGMVSIIPGISAQTGAPCNAVRWNQGAHWTGVGCGVNDANNAPAPLGIVRCANAADTESGIDDNTTYDPNVFMIVPSNCEDPNTNLPVTVTPPFTGQKISWFNFDVRPYAGIYDFQTIATGNYELEWALYYSTDETCGTGVNGLSGDCAVLSGVIACGTDFNGWSPQPFITPIFNLPTNLYLVVWKKGATNSNDDDFDFTFKARYGCGDFCSLFPEGNPTVTCNLDGTYSVVQNLSGTNTTITVSAPGSLSIVTNPSPLVFTTADAIPNVNTGTVTVTYAAGVNYNITMTPSGTGIYCTALNIAGVAPICCVEPTCSIDGPSLVCPGDTTQHCAPAGAEGYAWSISGSGTINGPTDTTCVSVIASDTCNRSYTLTLVINNDTCTATCTKMVMVNDTTPPVITNCPANITISCTASTAPANTGGSATATDNCDSAPTVTYSDMTVGSMVCTQEYTINRTWSATDNCGNTSTCLQVIIVDDSMAPSISSLPAPSSVECPATPSFATPTATDNCDMTPSLTFSDVTTPGTCPQEYSVTRTWTATDDCGNSSTASQTISVTDNTAPVISSLPAPSSVECPATPSFATPTATDACDMTPSLTFSDVTTPGTCPQEYSVTRTWTATDDCGNSSTASQVISVTDNTAPVISSLPAPSSVECPAIPSFATPTATDACDMTSSLTFSDVTTPGTCPQEYSVTRTWTATDDCGNSSTASQVISVTDNTAPVISSLPAPSSVECPATPSFATPTATDACDMTSSLTFSDVTTPGTCPQEYSVTRTWTATDDCGNSSTASQMISVTDNTAPVLSTLPGPSSVECPATPSFTTPTATDLCDMTVDVTFSDVTTPGTCPQEYSVTRTWTATDDCGNASTAAQTISVTDNTAPVLSTLPGPSSVECPATPSFTTPTATDACDLTPSLTFSDVTTPGTCPQEYSVTRTWTATDDCGNTSTAFQIISVTDNTAPVISALPAASSVECPATPSFTTPTATDACDATPFLTFSDVTTPGSCPQEYSVTRTWAAVDDCGNASTASQTISVTDTTAPVISSLPAPGSVECPATPSFTTPTATDACDGTPSLTFSDVTTPGTCPQEYSVTRTWTAMDDCGNSSTASQTISVTDNTAPVISSLPAPSSVECPATPSFATPTATDACDATPSLTFSDVNTPGTCPQEYSVTRTWTAMDDCGNTSTAFQIISVTDNTAPVLSTLPGPSSVECPATPSFTTPTAIDICDATPSLTFSDVTTPGTCPQEYSVKRTWTATDDCGNTSTAFQIISVTDTTAPVLGTLPGPSSVSCPATPSFTTPTVTDACDITPSLTFNDVTTPGTCTQEYSVTRNWTATDSCGNSSTASQTISVIDTTGPICATQDITLSIDLNLGYVLITPTQINNGSSDLCGPVTLSVSQDSFTCDDVGLNVVTLTVTDLCGNTSSCTATVTITECYNPCVTIVGWVYLEGSATDPNGLPIYTVPMRTTLNDLQVLPGQTLVDPFFGNKYTLPGQPYDVAPWNYMGNEGDAYDSGGDPNMGDAGYPSTVTDWVLVSLRADSAGTGGPVCQAAALLHNNGYIDFVQPFDCCDLNLLDSFYLVVEHRNHLIVMSHNEVPIVPGVDSSTITYDFRMQQSYVDDPFMFGIFAQQKEILPGVYAMFAGNGDQALSAQSDTDINFDDRGFWATENGDIGEYRTGDYNMNGDTNFNDRVTWERNNGRFTSVPRN